MLASVCFGLLSSRWLLAYLGDENFGTLAALGASGAFVLFFSISLMRGLQREVTFHTGKGDLERARLVFGSSVGLFGTIAAVMFIVMMFLRPYILSAMVLPAGKLPVVEWVYLVAMGQIVAVVVVSPYRAALEAGQHLAALSALDTVLSALNLGMMLILSHFTGEPLLVVSLVQGGLLLLGLVGVLTLCFYYCRSIVGVMPSFRFRYLGGVFSITGWSMFGHLNWILRNEGAIFALNVFFGPAVNASYALALRLNAFQNEFAFAVVRALQPALTTAVAVGERDRERSLTLLGSKLPVLASLFVWVPILFCAEEIFHLWLGRVPEGAPLFLRMLGLAMIGMASYGHQMALESHGRLAGVTLWMTLPPIATFAIWCFVQREMALTYWSLAASQLVVGLILVLVVRPILHGAILAISMRSWLKAVAMPIVVTHVAGVLCALVPWLTISDNLLRLTAVTACSGVGMAGAIWRWGLQEDERSEVGRLAGKVQARLGSLFTR